MDYKEQTRKAMELLAQDPRVVFIGQTVRYPGSPIFMSLENINLVESPLERRLIEMPVAEDMQMGMSIGMSLEGLIPVSVYPRIDFLIPAMNQLINHLDKVEEMSHKVFKPKVIIRTQIGNTKPLYPGLQHCSDYTDALKVICKNIDVVRIETAEDVMPEYEKALNSKRSTILIEIPTGGTKAYVERYGKLK